MTTTEIVGERMDLQAVTSSGCASPCNAGRPRSVAAFRGAREMGIHFPDVLGRKAPSSSP
jgi:hypothetical protein